MGQPANQFDSLSDGRLLTEFVERKDRAALSELIARHHHLVQGVCRGLLGNTPDADDAYQATFLVLVRNSHKIRKSAALGSWLYGVAYRVGSRIRHKRSRWKTEPLQESNMTTEAPLESLTQLDQQAATLDAIARLPEKLRLPVVMRYLQDRSNREVADQLAISESAVEGRIKRAKARLRVQLIRQGLTLSLAFSALNFARRDAEASSGLIDRTIDLCSEKVGSDVTSTMETTVNETTRESVQKIINLSQEELGMMATLKFTKLALSGCLAVVAAGVCFSTHLNAFGVAGSPGGSAVQTVVGGGAVDDAVRESTPTVTVQVAETNHQSYGPSVRVARVADENTFNEDTGGGADPFGNGGEFEENEDVFGDEAADDPFGSVASSDDSAARSPPPSGPSFSPDTNAPAATLTPASPYSSHKLTAAEAAIYKALDAPTQVEFYDAPVSTVVDMLSDFHSIPIRLDLNGLETMGLTPDTPVTLKLQNVRLRSALNHLASDLEMAFTVKDEVLLVTSAEKALENVQVRVYQLDRLLRRPSPETFTKMLTTTIAPDSWDNVGGNGSISFVDFDEATADQPMTLVVRQTPEVHEQIDALLQQIEDAGN